MSFVENGYVEVNNDEPDVLLHGAVSGFVSCGQW